MKRDKNITWNRVDPSNLNLKGMKVTIIGGTGGIGRAISRLIATRGGSVVVVGQTFRDADLPGIEFIKADLSLLREAERVGKLLPVETHNIVIFTTGIMAASKRQETDEGIERDMAVSYLNRLVILREIAPRLGKRRQVTSIKPRVFIMGFPGTGEIGNVDDLNAERSYSGMKVHMNTVAGNEMLVLDSATRYRDINFYGLNPGIISTNIRSNFLGEGTLKFRIIETFIGALAPTAETYAKRLVPLFVSPDIESHSGTMFDKKGNAILSSEKLLKAILDSS